MRSIWLCGKCFPGSNVQWWEAYRVVYVFCLKPCSPSSRGVCENIRYLGNGMMGHSFVFYFSAFSHFLWQSCMTFIMEWHIFIKRKLFPSIFIVFKLLWSLSLKYTWDESVLKPLSVKTWQINTWGGEPRWCPEGKQREGDESNVSPELFPHLLHHRPWAAPPRLGSEHSALDFVHCTQFTSQGLSLATLESCFQKGTERVGFKPRSVTWRTQLSFHRSPQCLHMDSPTILGRAGAGSHVLWVPELDLTYKKWLWVGR